MLVFRVFLLTHHASGWWLEAAFSFMRDLRSVCNPAAKRLRHACKAWRFECSERHERFHVRGDRGDVGFEVPSQYSNTAPEITETIERTTTTIGAAHQDKSRELKAAFANMKPVQYVALALILAALPLFYYGWPTPALLCGATGIGMLMFAHLIVSNSQIMTVLLVLGVVLMLVFRAYNKGQLDRWLPDSLDKKKRDASPDQ